MVKQSIQIFARVKPTKKTTSVYCVDNEEPTGSLLEFLVPKDLADGFVNNKKETYKFRFQEVFDQTVKQEDIFEAIAKPVADRKVTIMEDPDQNIHLRNLSLQQSANEEEALNLLFLGDTNRMIAETPMNQASTRSHCIFTMHVCGREPGSVTMRRSKLHLVDLAGSERVGKTGVCGQLLTEAKYINLSLHYLEQVIIALSEKNRSHIPYRNSMMTSVLRDSLGGNCMTTMIATVSVDKRNVDESISTCRFAQRVALIRNDALLNEELDPALLIVRLKREIQSLKEELSMVTGEKREDQLTQEEIHKLEELVKVFLDDPDPEVTLALGPDMRKIHYCFSLLKVMIRERLSIGDGGGDHRSPPPPVVVSNQKDSPQLQPADLTKLREMLTQRDNEISILVSILKKEKRRAQDTAAKLAIISNGRPLAPQSPLRLSTASLAGDTEAVENDHGVPPTLYGERGSELSMGKQEAFEIFRRDHKDRLTIEDNKALLKQRFAEAKAYGEEVNEARNGVNKLKKQLELRRMQRAAHGVTGSPAEVEEVDPVEENIRTQMDEEKKSYKRTFGRLKTLKMEIEHLQLLLERSKVKLQRDFQDWWSQETARLQQVPESEGMARGQSSIRTNQSSESSSPSHPMTRNFVPSRHIAMPTVPTSLGPPADDSDSASAPSSKLRALSSTELSKSFIPLTGDQQTDADILGFIRARHNLLNRTGPPQP
ncbi:kinesin-like protein KIF6 isoform X3 [Coregonus clupeaformis]|uniref:kinesin-like protein KIF6 isoform X3 n=1 Tax=Coregonus clupeaformis TaxID=59861 RepID=UPI001BE0E624|nr:kinesin-like protein KIF6 isoform X3 [Coregonus clupeaformis]